MKVSYYPGCSLEGTAQDFDKSIRSVAQHFRLKLEELQDWNCCGATAAHSVDHDLALSLAARNLTLAESAGNDVVVPCALCFNRLKVVEKACQNQQLEAMFGEFAGSVKVWDLLDFLTQKRYLQELESRIVKPLAGLKAVGYYGCLVARPPEITDKQDAENPQNMERLLDLLGAQALDWSYKTDCCGAGLAVPRPDIIDTLVERLYEEALAAGANCFVVSCQMCQANLDLPQRRISQKFGKSYYLPVFYFTELMALAMGDPEVRGWFRQHLVDPLPLLQEKGLW